MTRFVRALVCAAAFFAVAGCADEAALAPAPPPDPHTQMAALEIRIFEIVQDERHKIDPNAKSLSFDPELAGAAREHSADMAAKNYFAHKGPDGETSAGLIMDEDAKFQGLLGENLAAQYFTIGTGIDVEIFARRFVDSWLASPSHRDNLAYAAYDRSGVGAAVNGNMIYVTQLFATDLGLNSPSGDPKSRKITELPSTKSATGRYGAPAEPSKDTSVLPEPRPTPSN